MKALILVIVLSISSVGFCQEGYWPGFRTSVDRYLPRRPQSMYRGPLVIRNLNHTPKMHLPYTREQAKTVRTPGKEYPWDDWKKGEVELGHAVYEVTKLRPELGYNKLGERKLIILGLKPLRHPAINIQRP